MRAYEVFRQLLDGAINIIENTCDVLIAGDENKEVKKIGVCFKLTAELIHRAIAQGIDLIITHEPTFSRGDRREDAAYVDLKKWALLDESGITVYRFHDHAHNRETDYIHDGFIKALDLQVEKKYPRESLGICRYALSEELTVKELAKRIRQNLGVEFVRIVGKDDYPLKTVCLGLGCVGLPQIEILFDPGCDLFITGEVDELFSAEAVRDACFFGENKSILLLGHYSSEYAGMKLLADKLNQSVCDTVFLDGKEVYHSI